MTSTFSDPEEFQTAMSVDGSISFLFTGGGQFRARSTELRLNYLRLVSFEESLPCIAFIRIPPEIVLVGLSIEHTGSLTWGGIMVDNRELTTLGAGQCVHMRSGGPCHWGAILLPVQEFTHYSRALTGETLEVPPWACRRRPPPRAGNQLRRLYLAGVRRAQAGSGPATGAEAAHGLEQQLIYLLVECLSAESAQVAGPTKQRKLELMARFEELIRTQPEGSFCTTRISSTLGVSDRFLRECCAEHLGTSPMGYVRLHRMQLVNRALLNSTPQTACVVEVAERFGFRNSSRFAAAYRALHGELPSATLRRRRRGLAEIVLSDRSRDIRSRNVD